MHFFLDKITTLKIGWNERPLGEADFYRLCKRLKVNVTEMPLRTGGFYYRVLGKDHIAIDSRLTGAKKLLVQFHELAHFLGLDALLDALFDLLFLAGQSVDDEPLALHDAKV